MKSKSFMLMILSMGFGLIAAIGISQVMGRSQANATPVTEMGPVLVAADHLDMKTLLTTENVKIENWPLNIIPEDAATKIEDIADMVNRTRLSKGMPIVKSTIVNKKDAGELAIPDGFKVVAIKVSGDSGLGGLLDPGDKVDVIGLFKRRNNLGQTQTTTRTFLKALRVFSVNSQMTARDDRQDNTSNGSAIVGVLVTEKQSEEIYYVQRTGEIKLVLRGDHVETDEEVEDLSEIMAWGDLDVPGSVDGQPETDGSGLLSTFGVGGKTEPVSMTVWIGNTAEVVTFETGKLPRSSAPALKPAPKSSENDGDEGGNEEADSDGSNEIDRGLEQDQYRGE
jgi:pilus assembly protein CpaB